MSSKEFYDGFLTDNGKDRGSKLKYQHLRSRALCICCCKLAFVASKRVLLDDWFLLEIDVKHRFSRQRGTVEVRVYHSSLHTPAHTDQSTVSETHTLLLFRISPCMCTSSVGASIVSILLISFRGYA